MTNDNCQPFCCDRGKLSTVNCQLSTANCQLPTVNCQLSTVIMSDSLFADASRRLERALKYVSLSEDA
ncbi:hypothetical protein FM036_39270, partial [Nostoc sp. HG1]|nr:hypothetical protein [Nostoc sp. HG1]